MAMVEVSSGDKELVSAFEDAVEKIESLAMGQSEHEAQPEEGRSSEKKDHHTDQSEGSIANVVQGLEPGNSNDSVPSGEAIAIKEVFEGYIESQSEVDSGSAEESAIVSAEQRMDDKLPQTSLASEILFQNSMHRYPRSMPRISVTFPIGNW